MKIVYCINSVSALGGTEIVTLMKADALARTEGYEVWIAFTEKKEALIVDVSTEVHLIDLQIRYDENSWRFPWNSIQVQVKRIQHKRVLAKALAEIRPDIVISVGKQEQRVIPLIRGKWKTILEFHLPNQASQLSARSFPEKVVHYLKTCLGRGWETRGYDRYVALSQEERETQYGEQNLVSVIPNPLRFFPSVSATLEEKRVLAVGRLTHEKNFVSLVRAFEKVTARYPEWHLDIYGTGPEYKGLLQEIQKRGLAENVSLKGFKKDIQEEMLLSSIFVLSSLFESFAMVIPEAMSCGLPVVAYDCPTGPRAIITDGEDGFLVPVGDEELLAERICRLIGDRNLRKKLGAAARERARDFTIEKILPQWTELFQELAESTPSGVL